MTSARKYIEFMNNCSLGEQWAFPFCLVRFVHKTDGPETIPPSPLEKTMEPHQLSPSVFSLDVTI